jgi:FixJ family two-component response regulator
MNKRILVIDDEKPTLRIFRLLLSAYGYEVHTAENGQEGLEVFESVRPDIVLTDIKMPIMDGIEVLKNIKRISPYAEVVVITGHGDIELALQALHFDATDFINKPVRREVLEKALERAQERLAMSRREEEQVVVEQEAGEAVIRVRGNVSNLTVPRLREAFAVACGLGVERVSVRFEKSVSINGAGISALSECLQECARKGLPARIQGLSRNFRTVFQMVGIANLAELDPEEPASTEQA